IITPYWGQNSYTHCNNQCRLFQACGPTLQRTCGQSIYVMGRCYQLDSSLRHQQTLPPSLPECPVRSLDIAFLIDGSGSIDPDQFQEMLTFVSKVIEDFEGTDTLFAIMQYSNLFTEHFNFKKFSAARDKRRLIWSITQLRGTTWTATGIQKVLRELFIPSSGSRHGSQKFLIVITDGEKYGDTLDYSGPIAEAEGMGVVRFAIGVTHILYH
uniref:VWFA domain-containing protein n=1 Tax=Xenopus tropicalis TaxID=8364 RepID=A0A803JX25_XENTR